MTVRACIARTVLYATARPARVMVPHLTANPSNLRTLSARNDGEFPYITVMRQIDGRDMRAVHGSADMPVWGWHFSRVDNDMRDPGKQTQARIDALVQYLETIQD